MASQSDYTKKAKLELLAFRVMDFLVLCLPLIVAFFSVLANGSVTTTKKVGLVGMVAIAGIITLVNIIGQKHLRSPIWIAMVGFTIAVSHAVLLVILCAVSSVADEFIFAPLISRQKARVAASKVYDERSDDDVRGA